MGGEGGRGGGWGGGAVRWRQVEARGRGGWGGGGGGAGGEGNRGLQRQRRQGGAVGGVGGRPPINRLISVMPARDKLQSFKGAQIVHPGIGVKMQKAQGCWAREEA